MNRIRPKFSARHLAAGLAIVTAATLLGGGVAVAQRGEGRGDGPRNGHGHGRHHRHGPGFGGTITALDDPNFALERRNGESETLTTDEETKFILTVDAAVADATPGSHLLVRGERSEDETTVAAKHIAITPEPASDSERKPRGATVLTNDGSTLTIQRKNGDVLTVTTSDDTHVTKTTLVDFDALAVDQFVKVGVERPAEDAVEDAPLVAKRVHIDLSSHPRRPEKPTTTTTSTTVAESASGSSVQGVTLAQVDDSSTDDSSSASDSSDDGFRRGGHTGGEITAIDGATFTITNRGGTITVVTNDNTMFVERAEDGTISEGSLADLAVGDKVKVAGARQDDGSVLAARVMSGDCDDEDRPDGSEARGGDDRDGADRDDDRDDGGRDRRGGPGRR